MATTSDVKKALPGIQFRVEEATKGAKTLAGTQHGILRLRCEFTDSAVWEAAIQKLDGFKVFGDIAGEIVDAIGEALDNTDKDLRAALIENENLTIDNMEKDREIERLRGLLQQLEVELDNASAPDSGRGG